MGNSLLILNCIGTGGQHVFPMVMHEFIWMKRSILILVQMFFLVRVHAQQADKATLLLIKLDSISKCSTQARHFANIYFETTVEAVNFFRMEKERTREVMESLE